MVVAVALAALRPWAVAARRRRAALTPYVAPFVVARQALEVLQPAIRSETERKLH